MLDLEIRPQKNQPRQLSLFHAKGMTYDYLLKKLDSERSAAYEKALKNYPELSVHYSVMKHGLWSAQKLKECRANENFKIQMNPEKDEIHLIVEKLKADHWPKSLRFGFETAIVGLGIISICLVIPWQKVTNLQWTKSSAIVLNETTHTKMSQRDYDTDNGTVAAEVPEVDEGLVAAHTSVKEKPAEKAAAVADKKIEPIVTKPVVAETKTQEKINIQTNTKAEDKQNESSVAAATIKPGGEGALYRGTLHVVNVGATNTKLVDKLTALGGRKAGDVPLGWRKGSGAYFHFTIPESKYNESVKYFEQFGVLKIKKEKHERVMPEGIMRVIISVEEK